MKLTKQLDDLNEIKKGLIEKHFDKDMAKKAKAVAAEKTDLTAAGQKLKKLWGWDD